jgi:hypothetical protein
MASLACLAGPVGGQHSPITSIAEVQPDTISIFPLNLRGGDGQFGGNGPIVSLVADLWVSPDGCTLSARVNGWMNETVSPGPKRTVARADSDSITVYVAEEGKRIEGILSLRHQSGRPANQELELGTPAPDSLSYTADGYEVFTRAGKAVVGTWRVWADDKGRDIPDYSRVHVRFRKQYVLLRERQEGDEVCD